MYPSFQESLENNEEDEKVKSGKSLFHPIYFKSGIKGYLSKETTMHKREGKLYNLYYEERNYWSEETVRTISCLGFTGRAGS